MNSNNVVLTLVIVIVIIVAIAIIAYFAQHHGSTTNIFPVIRPRRPNRPNRPSNKIIGGCAGTRWGCCPDGKTARTDKHGKNCG